MNHRMLQTRTRTAVALFSIRCLLAGALLWTCGARATQTQTIRLDPGWNLIAFQVIPTNPAPASVFGGLGSAFERAFTYDNPSKSWSSYQGPANSDANEVSPMAPIVVGQAYWVYMNQAIPAWSVSGDPAPITSPVNLVQGWNLIGIPTGAGVLDEPLNILSVLAVAGLEYDTLLKWEQGLYAKFTPNEGDVDDFTVFDPNRGYWVNVKSGSFSLQPKLLSSLRPDQDVEPVGNYPAAEDLQLSTSPTPLGPNEQTHLVFLPGEDAQQIAIANTGGGILLWELSATNAPWLSLSATHGVTTIENDVITVSLDRRFVQKGAYTTTLFLRTTAGNRNFTVVAHVPGLGGDWRGLATIDTANGRHNPLPQIDLHLSFFEDAASPNLLRGLIDSQNALLWPVDVSLIGHAGAGAADGFKLSGGYVLPPGDVNNAPFGVFDGNAEDVDWNCDGKLDAVNPFPFALYRSVTLVGALTEAGPVTGYRIQGEYTEVVYGMMREPIHLRGTFDLRRDSLQPFASRRVLVNQEPATGVAPVVASAFRPPNPMNLPAGRSVNALDVLGDLALQGVEVAFDISDAPASALKISLMSPSGQSVVLMNHRAVSSLKGLSFPKVRRPEGSLDAFASAGASTRGKWVLVVENDGPIVGHLASWSLRLSGQPVFSVAGRVVDSQGAPLPGQVFLDGLPITEVTQADASGRFRFDRVPGIPMNFSASLGGYEAATPGQPGVGGVFTTPRVDPKCASPAKLAAIQRLRPLPVAPIPSAAHEAFGKDSGTLANPYELVMAPQAARDRETLVLSVAPDIGFAPLETQLSISAGIPVLEPFTWSYGDGTVPDVVTTRVRAHTYTGVSPTGFVASVTYNLTGAPATTTRRILPMPSPGHATASANFFQINFTGGGSYPAGYAGTIMGTNDVTGPAALADLIQVQHAYCASFDIDLAPKVAAAGRRFDSDGFDPLNTLSNAANRVGGFRDEDFNYQPFPGDQLGQWSMAAECGYAVADDLWSPHPKVGQSGECAQPRFQMLCNLGGAGMFIMPPASAEVYAVSPGNPPVFPSEPDPTGIVGAAGIATARQTYLITGPLASFWKQ